ncbi:MAG TPA: sugar phosphate isomerase/epimerase family protein [Planctomicrobium sp.]|nr:sugar phosphate isomerase/epimerase family protein [Planctomicrobium sp.]
MRLGLINSAWSQSGHPTSWGIAKTKEIGFDCIDLQVDPLETDVRERRLIKKECERHDLPIVSLCCVSFGLSDFNRSVQEFHLERCRKHLDLAYEFEAENLLLVLGEYVWNQEVIPPAEQWSIAARTCRELAEYADRLNLKIALELEPFPLSLLNNVESMVRFLDDVNHPALAANIDISHLHLAKVDPEELDRLQGKAIHVHISDCDGKKHGDLPPGMGVVDFPPYLEAIRKLNLPGALSIELEFSPEPDKIEEWVSMAYHQTAKLMQDAGLRV